MSITDEIALSADSLVIPVAGLPARVRDQIGDEGAFVVTRTRSRSPSVLVDRLTASLLEEFRQPSTIVAAVLRLSRQLELEPEAVLEQSFPIIRRFLAGGYLTGAAGDGESVQRIALPVGRRIAGGTVVRCVRVLEDTELYQVLLDEGGFAALKLLKPEQSQLGTGALAREARILRRIDGRVAPRILTEGLEEEHHWLCMEWCEGSQLSAVAAASRRLDGHGSGLLELCRAVVRAYAELHDMGLVHGDVHPGNVLASPSGRVTLIDFGLARAVHEPGDPLPRGGVLGFFDPWHAKALLGRTKPPPPSYESDLYSLGAVLYQLLTGASYLDLSIERDEALRQIAEDPPLPFAHRDRPAWPEMEAVLAAALSKDDPHPLGSVAALASRLSTLRADASSASPRPRVTPSLERMLADMIALARPGGAWFERGLPAPPLSSVAYGAAGLAAALCRVALLRSDPQLLSLADEWVVRAARDAGQDTAFANAALQLDESRTGLVSPFHRMSGVHAVQALVSHAVGDTYGRRRAIDGFVAESGHACASLDLALGRSGTLLTAALLVETLDGVPGHEMDALSAVGDSALADIWQRLDEMPAVRDERSGLNLGVAHGWAGVLLATLRWCRACGAPMPEEIGDRLDQLAGCSRPEGLGLRWPWTSGTTRSRLAPTMPGWCNGSAGFVHLWIEAHQALGDERWGTLAERAAWDAYTTHGNLGQLCCGLAGQAYALLALYRHTGEPRWLRAASELGGRAAAGVSPATSVAASLHKGSVGVAVLAADLAEPESAVMPFFGADGRHA